MTADAGDQVGLKKATKKIMTDADLQKKSVKLVVLHLRKKVDPNTPGIEQVCRWLDEMDFLLAKDTYVRSEYLEMRKKLNDAIEWVFDTETRQRLRNSWYSFGKAMDKKVPRN